MKMIKPTFILIMLIAVITTACKSDDNQVQKPGLAELSKDSSNTAEQQLSFKDSLSILEQQFIDAGLIGIRSINPEIMVDLKYASEDNFMGINMYGFVSDAYMQRDIAERLAKVQNHLTAIDSHLMLYVFDAVRPVSVQQMMWDALDSIPVAERIKFVSNPAHGSIHNYGAAIDLSIFDKRKDTLLDMGAGYDDLRKIAYPSYETHFLSLGELSTEQINNRKLLRRVMRKEGFTVLDTEWWHFNACSRETAKKLYEVIP